MSAAATMTWDPFGGLGQTVERVRPARRMAHRAEPSSALLGSSTSGSTSDTAPGGRTVPSPATHLQEKRLADADWQAVVRRCLNGDPLAWSELVRAHHGRVYGLCYRFTGSSHDAEDLTQDVFLKVYGNLRTFDAVRGSFGTWLTTMTRNLLVDHFRRTKGQRITDSMDAGWEESEGRTGAERLGMHLEDKGRNPHQQAMQRELETMVQQALTRVSPELREAVILRDLQDMDYKEIAQVLRVPEGTVKSRISRGRAELARLLDSKRTQVS